jgi:hypothetical protein
MVQIMMTGSPANRKASGILFVLQLGYEESYDDRDEGSTFYKGCSQDHVSADITKCFRLTSDRFHGFTPDRTYTDTGADGGQTHSYCCN